MKAVIAILCLLLGALVGYLVGGGLRARDMPPGPVPNGIKANTSTVVFEVKVKNHPNLPHPANQFQATNGVSYSELLLVKGGTTFKRLPIDSSNLQSLNAGLYASANSTPPNTEQLVNLTYAYVADLPQPNESWEVIPKLRFGATTDTATQIWEQRTYTVAPLPTDGKK